MKCLPAFIIGSVLITGVSSASAEFCTDLVKLLGNTQNGFASVRTERTTQYQGKPVSVGAITLFADECFIADGPTKNKSYYCIKVKPDAESAVNLEKELNDCQINGKGIFRQSEYRTSNTLTRMVSVSIDASAGAANAITKTEVYILQFIDPNASSTAPDRFNQAILRIDAK